MCIRVDELGLLRYLNTYHKFDKNLDDKFLESFEQQLDKIACNLIASINGRKELEE